jgi:hypothetical protein
MGSNGTFGGDSGWSNVGSEDIGDDSDPSGGESTEPDMGSGDIGGSGPLGFGGMGDLDNASGFGDPGAEGPPPSTRYAPAPAPAPPPQLTIDLPDFSSPESSSSSMASLAENNASAPPLKQYDFSQFDTYIGGLPAGYEGLSQTTDFNAPYVATNLSGVQSRPDAAGLLSIDYADPDIIASQQGSAPLPMPSMSDDAERETISSSEAIRQHQIDDAEYQRQQNSAELAWGNRESVKLLSVPLVSAKGIGRGL